MLWKINFLSRILKDCKHFKGTGPTHCTTITPNIRVAYLYYTSRIHLHYMNNIIHRRCCVAYIGSRGVRKCFNIIIYYDTHSVRRRQRRWNVCRRRTCLGRVRRRRRRRADSCFVGLRYDGGGGDGRPGNRLWPSPGRDGDARTNATNQPRVDISTTTKAPKTTKAAKTTPCTIGFVL